jgi:hypothetical protein
MKSDDQGQTLFDAVESKTLSMRGSSMRENRETPAAPSADGGEGRPEKATSSHVRHVRRWGVGHKVGKSCQEPSLITKGSENAPDSFFPAPLVNTSRRSPSGPGVRIGFASAPRAVLELRPDGERPVRIEIVDLASIMGPGHIA